AWIADVLREVEMPERDVGDVVREDARRDRLLATSEDPALRSLGDATALEMAVPDRDERVARSTVSDTVGRELTARDRERSVVDATKAVGRALARPTIGGAQKGHRHGPGRDASR